MIFGNLQRRWQQEQPAIYDKETHIVCLDIKSESQVQTEGDTPTVIEGFSFIPIEIDSQIDYGHIKSQLIEAGFAQKDEFGLVMNAVDSVITAITENDTIRGIKSALDSDDIKEFRDFCEFRQMCADAAHAVVESYQ